MDIRQLRYFLTIVEEGSITRAAGRLRVAQPALSMHVRKMEAELGTPLLMRSASGVAATEAGAVLAQRARAVLSDMAHMAEEVRGLGQRPTGTVRIGLPGTISVILSVPLIARAHARYPGIKIIVAEAMSGFVRDWLREGRIDLGVLYGEAREPGIGTEALLQEELVLLTPPGAAAEGSATLAMLARMPLILPSGSHGLRRMVEQRLRAADVAVEPAIEVDSYPCIKRLVAGGYGCSVLPYHTVAGEGAQGLLSVRRFGEPRLWRSAHLAWQGARPPTRAAQCVRELLRDEIAGLIRRREWDGAELIA